MPHHGALSFRSIGYIPIGDSSPASQRHAGHAGSAVNGSVLESFPADTWQDRWLLSGSDDQGGGWGPQGLSAGTRARYTASLGILIVLREVRPSYPWLCGSRLLGFYDAYRSRNQPALFAQLREHVGGRGGCSEHGTEALNVLTRMSIATGKDLLDFDLEDLPDYAQAQATRSPVTDRSSGFAVRFALFGLASRGRPAEPPTPW